MWDGIDEIQQQQLKKRLPKNGEAENWNSIYAILFPECPLPESPCMFLQSSKGYCLLTDSDIVLDDLNGADDMFIMREWFRQHASEYLERQEVPSELRENKQHMQPFLNGVLNAMIDGYANSCEQASISAAHTPRSQGRQTMLQDTPSDKTNSTPATSFGSGDRGTLRECSSPCLRPTSGPLPTSEHLQAMLAMNGSDGEGDGRCAIFEGNVAPTRMDTVPSFTYLEALDGDNSLGISFPHGLDLSITVDEPDLDSTLSEWENFMPGGDDTSPSSVPLI
jgi:hypothetical protein